MPPLVEELLPPPLGTCTYSVNAGGYVMSYDDEEEDWFETVSVADDDDDEEEADHGESLLDALTNDLYEGILARVVDGEHNTMSQEDRAQASVEASRILNSVAYPDTRIKANVTKAIIKCRPSVQALNRYMVNALHVGDEFGVFPFLLKAGADVRHRVGDNLCMMTLALGGGSLDAVHRLREMDVDWKTMVGVSGASSALYILAQTPHDANVVLATYAFEYGASVDFIVTRTQAPVHPLILAVRSDQPKLVKLLVDHMGTPNATHKGLGTAYYAHRSLAIMRVLTSVPSSPLAVGFVDPEGRDEIYMAVYTGHLDVAKLLVEYTKAETLPLRKAVTGAAKNGDVGVLHFAFSQEMTAGTYDAYKRVVVSEGTAPEVQEWMRDLDAQVSSKRVKV